MSLLALNLDQQTAGHLAVAIRLHRRALERAGHPCPPGLVDLQHLAVEVGRGQAGASGANDGDTDPAGAYGHRDRNDCELYTQRRAGELLGFHPRTVRRMVDRGELESVTVAGRRRIPRAELERFSATNEEAA